MDKFNFWNNFGRYLLIGLCSIVLLAAGQQMIAGKDFHKGPNAVIAEMENCDIDGYGCPEPGPVGDEVPTPVAPVTPVVPPAPEPAPAPVEQPAEPVAPPAPVVPAATPSCSDDLRYCDTNVNKIIHKTGGIWNGSQCVYAFVPEEACNTPAPVTPVTPPAQGGPTCTPNDQVRVEEDCVGNQLCKFNWWKGSSCNEGRGGAYGCQLIPGRCNYNPTTTTTPTTPVTPVEQPFTPPAVPACSELINSTTCGQPSYDTCRLHYEADGRARYDCVASQNHICVGSLYCGTSSSTITPQTPTAPAACPSGGQPGSKLYCDGKVWGYDKCTLDQSYSDGSPKHYNCKFSGNNACIGDVTCPAPAVSQPNPIACPTPGQAGTQIVCNGQYGYDDCRVSERNSNGTAKSYYCEYTKNRHCNGTILCAVPVASSAPAQGGSPVNITISQPHTQTQTQTQTNNQTMTVNNPPATTTTQVVYQTLGNVGVGTSSATPAYYAGIKQLPNTGLPALAWSALAFIPAGFRLRKLGSIKKELNADPNFIFEDRQFKSGS